MAGRNIIVIGASAGGVEALTRIVGELPGDFPAPLFVVVHFPSHGTSVLPAILNRAGTLHAEHAVDGEAIRPGRVYVAPPDRHLLVHRGLVRLSPGPRENGHRPAADPLFRSAARAYGPRVVGVVLTGNLDDGTAGLMAVGDRGGVTVVQDPADAQHKGMPSSAVANVQVDHVVPLAGMAALLARLASDPVAAPAPAEKEGEVSEDLEMEAEIAEMDPEALDTDDRPGVPSGYTCPECHGTLFEIREGELVRFRCRVGHAYGAKTLIAEQSTAVEAALWTALQALKERASLARRMAKRMDERGNRISRDSFQRQAREADDQAAVIREVLASGVTASEAAAD